jgi:nucleoside-diphosphate-sugar epimerase
VVLVTGASGFIAGSVVQLLLERGYQVRGTVRNLADETKVRHLRELFPALQLFEADLLTEGSFDEACRGADYVLHTASPFQMTVSDPQKDLVDPALKGTLNVLRAAAKSGTVKRVAVTSSCAAVAWQAVPPDDKVWTEEDWNEDSTLENAPYRLSKTLAERAAWQFVNEGEGKGKFDLAVINPSFVLGPPLSARTDSESVRAVKGFLSGTVKEQGGCRPSCFGCVDVRDVALAHVVAMEKPEAGGHRFIASSPAGISHLELVEMLRADPELAAFRDRLPTGEVAPVAHRPKYSRSKAEQQLGITFTPIEKAVTDMAKALVSLGVVQQ